MGEPRSSAPPCTPPPPAQPWHSRTEAVPTRQTFAGHETTGRPRSSSKQAGVRNRTCRHSQGPPWECEGLALNPGVQTSTVFFNTWGLSLGLPLFSYLAKWTQSRPQLTTQPVCQLYSGDAQDFSLPFHCSERRSMSMVLERGCCSWDRNQPWHHVHSSITFPWLWKG